MRGRTGGGGRVEDRGSWVVGRGSGVVAAPVAVEVKLRCTGECARDYLLRNHKKRIKCFSANGVNFKD